MIWPVGTVNEIWSSARVAPNDLESALTSIIVLLKSHLKSHSISKSQTQILMYDALPIQAIFANLKLKLRELSHGDFRP